MKAVILAGGYGKRLRPLTDTIPKPMLSVAGRPILEWQIQWLMQHGIKEVVLCVGYLKEKVIEGIGSGYRLGIKVGYVVEDEPLGTGGALKNAEHLLKSDKAFIVTNSDVITNIDPKRMLEVLNKYVGVVAVVPLPSPYGIVSFKKDALQVEEFKEKPVIEDYWINAGVYAFTSEVFKYLPERGDIEKTALPQLAREGRLAAISFSNAFWKSLDSHKDLEEVEAYLTSLKTT